MASVRIEAKAAADPKLLRTTSVYIATAIVEVWPVYNIIEAPSSLMVAIQLKIAPETIPGSINRAVTVKKVLTGGTPKLIEASSKLGSICCKIALEDRTVNGIFLIIYATIKINEVPAKKNGARLKTNKKAIPLIAAGTT